MENVKESIIYEIVTTEFEIGHDQEDPENTIISQFIEGEFHERIILNKIEAEFVFKKLKDHYNLK